MFARVVQSTRMAVGEHDLDVLLASMRPNRVTGTYVYAAVPEDQLPSLLVHAFALVREVEGASLVLEKREAERANLAFDQFDASLISLTVRRVRLSPPYGPPQTSTDPLLARGRWLDGSHRCRTRPRGHQRQRHCGTPTRPSPGARRARGGCDARAKSSRWTGTAEVHRGTSGAGKSEGSVVAASLCAQWLRANSSCLRLAALLAGL